MSNLIDTVLVFRILRKLTTPFEKTDAFKTGVIDKKGNVLVKPKDRNKEQKKAYTMLDRLVFNVKRVLPGGTVGSYLAALKLITEHVEETTNKQTATMLIERMEAQKLCPAIKHDLTTTEGFLDAMEEAMNEMTSGASFGGSLSGAGSNADVNASGLAGMDPTLQKRRRTKIEKILS